MAALKKKRPPPSAVGVPADPSQWCKKGQGSVPATFMTHYHDIAYVCASCRAPCVFSARDQQYAYEVRKNYIDVKRNLCEACWKAARHNAAAIAEHEQRWTEAKHSLQNDEAFLRGWLALLVKQDTYSSRCQSAAQGMLRKLLVALRPGQRPLVAQGIRLREEVG